MGSWTAQPYGKDAKSVKKLHEELDKTHAHLDERLVQCEDDIIKITTRYNNFKKNVIIGLICLSIFSLISSHYL